MSKIKHTIKPSNATAYSSNNPRTLFDQCAASTFSRNIPRMPFEQSAFEQLAFEQSANVHFCNSMNRKFEGYTHYENNLTLKNEAIELAMKVCGKTKLVQT